MGNLTLLGGLRGTKLELKGALGAPKEAPREPKSATREFGPGSTGYFFGRVEYFGSIGGVFWSYVGAWEASLKRFAENLKNHQKPCKVLQKWRFGGSQIR